MSDLQAEIKAAVEQRRNFAIISHPDAGKTTLTEKLLLYGGAIQQAGAVKSRRAQRHATSDWMELERRRGISITSTLLQFEYQGYHLNLLDTPGHQDFSEDTYRTLAAADNAVMLIDHSKGIESQTRKLFEVCRMRSLPTFTFINKLDRAGRTPLELLDEIEHELGLAVYAVNWPIGMGNTFSGVFDRLRQEIHVFERQAHGQQVALETVVGLEDTRAKTIIGPGPLSQLREDLEILDSLGSSLDVKAIHRGRLTPVFFGSALTNFGVKLFLHAFLQYAAKPGPHPSSQGEIAPTYPEFSGFVFKLQANMDPRHRDCLAFVRVCSGKFAKDMWVNHVRTGRTIRLSRPKKVFAQEREAMEVAYPGDVIGLSNPGIFSIGDTIYTGAKLVFPAIPSFAPELFAYLRNPDPSLAKKFQKGLSQLEQEGAVQVLRAVNGGRQEPILGAVGQLQFEVVQFRLISEYGVETHLDMLPHKLARWVSGESDVSKLIEESIGTLLVRDRCGQRVLLFKTEWHVQKLEHENPKLRLSPTAPAVSI